MGHLSDRQRRLTAASAGAVVVGGSLVLGTGQPVSAAVITVGGLNPGDPSSLGEAIDMANAMPGADTIVFEPSFVAAPLDVVVPELRVNDDLTIVGPGRDQLTIRNAGGNVLYQYGAASLTVSGITISGAGDAGVRSRSSGDTTLFDLRITGSDAEAVLVENSTPDGPQVVGALSINDSTLARNRSGVRTLRAADVVIEGSMIDESSGIGILLSSTLDAPTVRDVALEDGTSNSIIIAGSGAAIDSVAIERADDVVGFGDVGVQVRDSNGSPVTISDVDITNAGDLSIESTGASTIDISNVTIVDGGSIAIDDVDGPVTLSASSVIDGGFNGIELTNSSGDVVLDEVQVGGASSRAVLVTAHDGDLSIENSTMSGSEEGATFIGSTGDVSLVGVTIADIDGTALTVQTHPGSFDVVNSTVTGGLAEDQTSYGSVISLYVSQQVQISSSTISGNGSGNGAVIRAAGSTLNVANTVLAGNDTVELVGNTLNGDPSTVTVVDSVVPVDASVADGTTIGSSNVLADDPLLGTLADNGGPTHTMLPLLGSPLLDAGTDDAALATDQRGQPRIVNGQIDIGAVERGPADVTGELSIDDTQVDESAGSIEMTITRAGGAAGEARVRYVPVDGTAVGGEDFTRSFSSLVTWADGESGPKTVTVAFAVDDELVEGDETFTVELADAVGASIADGEATVTIIDDENSAPVSSLSPARFVDTRETGETFDDLYEADGKRPAGSELNVTMAGRGGVPADAKAVVMNVTAVGAEDVGFFTVHPCREERPLASSLNYTPGVNLANEIVAPLSDDGELCVYTSENAHVLVDVVGFVDAASPLVPVTPTRYLDTRATGRTSVGGELALQVADRGEVPGDAAAVIVNVTAVGPTETGFVTVHPCEDRPPNASSLNYVAGVNRANELIAPVSPTGEICLFTSSSIHLLVDVVGYLPAGSSLTPTVPARFLDTRPAGRTVDGDAQQDGPLVADGEYVLQIANRAGVPESATAVVVNVTVAGAQDTGFITTHPCADPRPKASSLNFVAGVNGANELVALLDADGNLCLYVSEGTNLIADVVGYVT